MPPPTAGLRLQSCDQYLRVTFRAHSYYGDVSCSLFGHRWNGRQRRVPKPTRVLKYCMPKRYTVDLNWVWGPTNPDLEGVATLRAIVNNPQPNVANKVVARWLETIAEGSGDSRWEGGWAVEVTGKTAHSVELELCSGGQDAAESLSTTVDALQDAVLHGDTTIEWTPLPIDLTQTQKSRTTASAITRDFPWGG